MLPAVRFDYEPGLNASEVGDERTDGYLAPELEAAELAVAQMTPKSFFGIGRIAPQPTGIGIDFADRRHHAT